jgi:hypothetical protein
MRYNGYIPTSRRAIEYSTDHGKTWHSMLNDALKCQGKVVLSRDTHGEFAFEAIQAINRKYDGPNYKWRP